MSPSPSLRRPEILAPAGDREAMQAAVQAGADAVYFGLHGFNARARASNFDAAELGATMRFLHEHGTKGYIALNTLVFDAELAAVEAAVRACASAGVDAVIVQDLGVARVVRAIAPTLAVHASTQMTCTDAGAVELARDAGASRVILARELSLEDIAKIRATTDVELEVFVHGALCIAYSGQCLTSEAIGGRSANRGACAQACRLPYELVVDGELSTREDRAYLLSPEDLETSALVPELMALGISSLKIEGRLKGPEYVAATTRLYRHAVEAALGSSAPGLDADRQAALQTFTRGSGPGFLQGIDHQRLVEGRSCDHRGLLAGACEGIRTWRGKRWLVMKTATRIARGDGVLIEGGFASEGEIGGRVWGVATTKGDVERVEAGVEALLWLGPDKAIEGELAGRRVFKTSDPAGAKEVLRRAAETEERKVPLAVKVSGAIGELPVFEGRAGNGARATVQGDAKVELARTAGSGAAPVKEKLARLGETPFALASLDYTLAADAMIPIASVNRARRQLVEALVAAATAPSHATTTVTHEEMLASALPPDRAPPPGGLFVLCRTLEQAQAAVAAGASGVYLDFLELTGTGAAVRALRARGNVHITLAPPRIRKPGEEKIDKYLADLEPDAILVRGLGALHEGSRVKGGPSRIGDFSLNVTNRLTAAEVLGRGLSAFTPSFDLDAAQLTALLASPFGPFAEVVLHHPMPLFHMEHCVIAALLSDGKDHKTCGRPCEKHQISLRDRTGVDHPVEADVGCRNTVFHAAAQSAANLVGVLKGAGVGRFRVELVREKADETARIVDAYRSLLDGARTSEDVWTQLRTQTGYGVVRGSLRVL